MTEPLSRQELTRIVVAAVLDGVLAGLTIAGWDEQQKADLVHRWSVRMDREIFDDIVRRLTDDPDNKEDDQT